MNLHDFIFSKKYPLRYYRHIAFWLARYLFLQSSETLANYLQAEIISTSSMIEISLQVVIEMICEIGYTYIVAYWILPKYLYRKKYFAFTGAMALITIIILMVITQADQFMIHSTSTENDISFLHLWGAFWGYTGYGPPSVCGLFIAIKILKMHYRKMEEKETLTRENANAELQLLKAQVHPHFLFNTLNNIYSFTLNQSPYAAELARNLSGTLRYMITDCEASLVPLEKELKMIRDYMELEKVRYGNRLDMQMEINGECENQMIAPFLIIPFIENCFKHGASQILDRSWIKMHIFIEANTLRLKLSNNKPPDPVLPNKKGGIGLRNVQKRLELLYPQLHFLQISPAPEVFRIYIQVPLHRGNEEIHAYAE